MGQFSFYAISKNFRLRNRKDLIIELKYNNIRFIIQTPLLIAGL